MIIHRMRSLILLSLFVACSLGNVTKSEDVKQTVVVLPPVFFDQFSTEIEKEANLICDRLSGALSASDSLQVVNRTELNLLLDERKIAGENQRSITSYSAMVRLEFVVKNSQRHVLLSILDLSSGNMMGQQKYSWPMKDSDLISMKKKCIEGVNKSAVANKDKVRIRFVGVTDVGHSTRLNPLAIRVASLFEKSLANSPKVLVLQHLEAHTSKEESLMIMMGLSKLPEGKHFLPHSNATIEVRLLEKDALGKTFPETTIVVGIKIQEAGKPASQWIETTGKVKKLDILASKSWRKVTQKLSSVRVDAFEKTMDEYRLRRKQAEAELRSAKANVNSTSKKDPQEKTVSQWNSAIAHCETALKLDPTFAEAQYELSLNLFKKLHAFPKNNHQMAKLDEKLLTFHRFVIESSNYLEHPKKEVETSADLLAKIAFGFVKHKYSLKLWKNKNELTHNQINLLHALRTVVLRGTDGGGKSYQSGSYYYLIPLVIEGMKITKTPQKEQTEFLLQCVDNVDQLFPLTNHNTPIKDLADKSMRIRAKSSRFQIRLKVAELLIESKEKMLARKLLVEAYQNEIAEITLVTEFQIKNNINGIKRLINKLNDSDELKKFEKWQADFTAMNLPIKVTLFQVSFSQTLNLLLRGGKDIPLSSVELSKPIKRNKYPPLDDWTIQPLAVGKDRIYFTFQRPNQYQIGYLFVDEVGNPIGLKGEISQAENSDSLDSNGFYFLPNEQGNSRAGDSISQAAVDDKQRLIIAFNNSKAGISIYTPTSNEWSHIGSDDGLPVDETRSFFLLGKDHLYCAGFGRNSKDFFIAHFTVNIKTKESTLLHRTSKETRRKGFYLSKYLDPVWWINGKLNGPFATDLLSKTPQKRPRLMRSYGHAQINDRLFVSSNENGLQEYDQNEKIINRWGNYNFRQNTLFQYVQYFPRLNNSPPRRAVMMASGKYLIFPHFGRRGLLLFDPEADTWYGPVGDFQIRTRSSESLLKKNVGSPSGVWLAGGFHFMKARYVKTTDIIQTAKEFGRVQTTTEYQQFLKKKVQELPLVHRAKANVLLGKYGTAEQDLKQWLTQEPNNAEALFLLAVIHDYFGLNKPEIALEYYQRLAKLSNPAMKLTSRLCMIELHKREKRWQMVIDTGNEILAISPKLPFNVIPQVKYRIKFAKQNLAKKSS